MSGDAAEAALSIALAAVSLAKDLQHDVDAVWRPAPEVVPPRNEPVVPSVLFKNARRTHLERVVHQINTTYLTSCFDPCAVMLRRLVESLIIEVFVAKKCADEMKDQDGHFLQLSQLIDKTLAHKDWNVTRGSQQLLKKLKAKGDTSAHNPYYNATVHDIDEPIHGIRVFVQEFLVHAGLR